MLVYERPDQPEWGFSGDVTEDGRYLIITSCEGHRRRKNRVFYKDLHEPGATIVELILDELRRRVQRSSTTTARSSTSRPTTTRRAAASSPSTLRKPERAALEGDHPRRPSDDARRRRRGRRPVRRRLPEGRRTRRSKVFDLDGKLVREVDAARASARVGGFGGKRTDTETFYAFTQLHHPATIYRYDVATGESTLFRAAEGGVRPRRDYETKQVFYTSKDGTRVPMFITHKKGLKLDGNNPTLLYGYGGFNISLTPAFSRRATSCWLEMGGVYAVANLRGGGEYGEEWHQAGTKLEEAERLRRLHRRGRVADRQEVHVAAEAGDQRRQQRRPAGRRRA